MVGHSLFETVPSFILFDFVPSSCLTLLYLSGECSACIVNSFFSMLILEICDPNGCVLNSVFFLLYALAWEEGRIVSSAASVLSPGVGHGQGPGVLQSMELQRVGHN